MRVHPSLYLSRIVCHTYTVWPPGMPPIEARSPDHTEHQTERTQGTRECVRVFFFFFIQCACQESTSKIDKEY